MRKIIYLISTFLIISLLPTASEATGDRGVSVRVLWFVTNYLPIPLAEYDKDIADSHLGMPLDMDTSSITFSGKSCSDISFSRKTKETQTYLLENLGITPDSINYSQKKLTEITTNCHLEGFKRFIRLHNRELLVPMKGFILHLKPNINYHNRLNR